MNTGAFEVLLLMTSLSQLRDQSRIRALFVEGLNHAFEGPCFRWLEPEAGSGEAVFEVCTRSMGFGWVAVDRREALDPHLSDLVHNAGQMLAVILEKLVHERALEEQNRRFETIAEERTRWAETLEGKVLERTRELEEANRSLADSRRNLEALNGDLEARVESRTLEIERARSAIESFSYTVSHDLRAPLRAIDGFSRVLLEDHGADLSDPARSLVDRIVARTARMGRLIDALLALSMVERRGLVLEAVSLSDLVDETIQEIDPGNPSSPPIAWRVSPLPCLRADVEMVRCVLSNVTLR